METTLFKHVLDGMIDNNKTNSGEFKNWDDAHHAINTYKDTFLGDEGDDREKRVTIECLNYIIGSNGKELNYAIERFNDEIWGKQFANNNGPTTP